MIVNDIKKGLAMGLSLVLIAVSLPNADAAPGTDADGAYDGAPMSASELQGLVAPIALYPDALVAQILAASTLPDQVAVADYWLYQNQNLTGTSGTGRYKPLVSYRECHGGNAHGRSEAKPKSPMRSREATSGASSTRSRRQPRY
jgi:hypothetical protein